MVQNVIANIPPCFLLEWGPCSACSVTCGIGVRYRTTECDSGNPATEGKQTTVEESCQVNPPCPQGTTNHGSLLLLGYSKAAMQDHVIKSAIVYSIAECGLMCLQDSSCKSFKTCSRKSVFLCELNIAT
ncbi:uncharacterized protein LOC111329969 [Stylophora pistillata]|uniref:uncharacterized protein LOC111329969 n=1 Tax=Stylophora pistillata TaxID=50429 RepID=UPI000C03E8D1|nr:uncharacterized protein LOC111329969 [Stylophora pistillata]